MYPSLLRFEPAVVSDVEAVLELCASQGIDVPVMPENATRVAFAELLRSPLQGARIQAARALGKDANYIALGKMLGDKSPIVRAVVRAVGGPKFEEFLAKNPNISAGASKKLSLPPQVPLKLRGRHWEEHKKQ
jgi:hypothetical protein